MFSRAQPGKTEDISDTDIAIAYLNSYKFFEQKFSQEFLNAPKFQNLNKELMPTNPDLQIVYFNYGPTGPFIDDGYLDVSTNSVYHLITRFRAAVLFMFGND